jgi:ketopantoate reductase
VGFKKVGKKFLSGKEVKAGIFLSALSFLLVKIFTSVRAYQSKATLTLFFEFDSTIRQNALRHFLFSIIINQSTAMSASREEEIVAEKLINEGMLKIMLTVC